MRNVVGYRISIFTVRKIVFFLLLFSPIYLGAPFAFANEEVADSRNPEDPTIQREELGVNPITAPSIQALLVKLESFGPLPDGFLSTNPRQVSFPNRFQTALHFGSLVADGLLLTIAEKEEDLESLSQALIRKAKSLDVSDRLTQRGKSLLELSNRHDWLGVRQELIRTQGDVEQSMMDLKDDVLADVVSMGGWFRGFQFACTVTDLNYVPQRARMLADTEVMDYYLNRLENLSPRLRKTALVQDMTTALKHIREIASQAPDQTPTHEGVHRLKILADRLFADIIAATNARGDLSSTPSPSP